MTRATLLHVLERPTALGPVEVRELEQLAQAFPYCQTAHLLLAKAAHDQGTMLAGQRLRRAATYAADRTLLRRLIEEVATPALEPAPASPDVSPESEAAAPAPAPEIIPAVVAPAATQLAVPAPQPEVVATPVEEPAPEAKSPVQETAPEPIQVDTVEAPAAVEASIPAPSPIATTPPQTETVAEETPVVELATSAPEPAQSAPEEALKTEADEPTDLFVETGLAADDIAPAQAPAIRPPVEVGEARFEFGLAEPPPPPPAYELPGLVDEWAAAAVTLSMGNPAAELEAEPVAPASPVYTPSAFTGDEIVGYGFGESSRLGYSMQLLDLLTAKAETDAGAGFLPAAGQPAATPLPPPGTFFEPDMLIADYWATHRPVVPVPPSSLDLINNFLRRQPRLTRPAMLPPSPTAQADLSVRSTSAEPDLASETLARILVRQGKTARAIEIYEKLMVKQPEKMAYFAAQIQLLQPPA